VTVFFSVSDPVPPALVAQQPVEGIGLQGQEAAGTSSGSLIGRREGKRDARGPCVRWLRRLPKLPKEVPSELEADG